MRARRSGVAKEQRHEFVNDPACATGMFRRNPCRLEATAATAGDVGVVPANMHTRPSLASIE
jgi:hypothetical protein